MQKQEFERMLMRTDLRSALLSMPKEQVESLFGPKVAQMVKYDQRNTHHIYDLFEHTMVTVENIPDDKFSVSDTLCLKTAAFLMI